ncbi:MAG: hypothetical protein P9M14_12545 [Candidatus Alcyoniella australis]|nr:hypothetical protein [Candidatus Alcyoniella australis]
MGKRGTVSVKNDRYYFDGDFHVIYPNTPICNQDGDLCGVTNPRDMTYVHSYGGEAPFFAGIAKGKLLATRCDNPDCESGYKSINIPFRTHCPDCLDKATVIDLTQVANDTAKVHTFMLCERSGAFNTLPKPIKFINVEFQGAATILMSYLPVGEPQIGMRVVPIFRTVEPTYTITDLAFVPEGTAAADLPEGFTFSK